MISRLWVLHAHRLCLYGGPNLTSSSVLLEVWILGHNRLVKKIVGSCIECQRKRLRLVHQLMGDLPADRVRPSCPFFVSGLDYAGLIQVRAKSGKGIRSTKGHICLFVCFSTRAVHLELVSDLTTDKFLLAFKRFVGRRSRLHSDNATTFHGADNELVAMFQSSSQFYKNVAGALAHDGTEWRFIPPNAPHYGKLWEAGVRSTKHHLKKLIEHTLTVKELSTVLVLGRD